MKTPVHLPTFKTAGEEAAYREASRIREMMASPAYRCPLRRDQAVVAEVDGFFRRNYAGTTEPARSPGDAPRGGAGR